MGRSKITTDRYGKSDYILVKHSDMQINVMQDEVCRLMGEGFNPLGGVTTSGAYLIQAMVYQPF